MTATAKRFTPKVPADLSLGSRWTYTSPTTGEVRNYVLESYHGRANIYRLYNARHVPRGAAAGRHPVAGGLGHSGHAAWLRACDTGMGASRMSVPKDIIRDEPGLADWAILHAYRGSIAHGTYEPSDDPNSIDDKDTMAFCVPPIDHYFGLAEYASRGTREIQRGVWDVVVYEARKAVRLLAGGNPNVLSMLWLPDHLYIETTDAGQLLITNRDLFVGKHVYKPFVGYATQQLYKMENGAHQGFMGAKRKALVDRHGYDTKNAAHLIRLLRQGIEFLNDGEMTVLRYDATELLAIKHGEWSLERVKDEAARLFRRAEDAYDRSTLPARPDRARVEALCVEVVETALRERAA